MPEQNLNPDAVEAGAKALFLRERKYHTPTKECPEPPNWENLTEISWEYYRGNARAVLSALPAQPELQENSKPNQNLELQPDTVNSVEELDELPDMSAVLDGDGFVLQKLPDDDDDSYWFIVGDTSSYYDRDIELPARVLYRPTEESSDGR